MNDWPTREAGVQDRCRDAGLSIYLKPTDHVGGGRGHKTRYCLSTNDLPAQISSLPSLVVADRRVTYFLDESKTTRWFWPRALRLDGTARWFFVALVWVSLMLPLLIGVVTLLVAAGTDTSTGGTLVLLLSGAVITGSVYSIGEPFLMLPDRRIIVAARWMVRPLEHGEWLLVLRRGDKKRGNAICLERYTAVCPVCGAPMDVRKGGVSFPFRLVGRCLDAPSEHVASFDHVTREGVLLRPEQE